MVLVSALGAKAQFNDAAISRMVATVNNQINTQMGISGESHISEADLAPLKGSLAARKRFLDSFTVHDSLPLSGKITFYNNEGKLVEKDTTMTMRILNVRKLKGDAKYNGVTAVLYGYNPKYEVVVPHVVMSYEPTPVAKTQTIPQGGGHGAQQVQGSQQGSGATKVGGLTPGQFLTDPNSGTTYVVIADQGGNPSLVPVNAMVPAGMQAIAQTTPQGGGQGAQQTTSTGSTTPTRYEPEVKYFQDEDGKSVPYYVSAEGHIMRLTDPNTPKQFDVDGVNVVYAMNENGVWEPTFTDKRNGYKFGVGDFAGYRANYYRDAINGAPLGTGNFRAGNVQMGWWGGQMMPCPGPGFFLRGNNWLCGSGGFGVTNVYPMQFGGVPAHVNPGAGFSHPMNPRNYPAN